MHHLQKLLRLVKAVGVQFHQLEHLRQLKEVVIVLKISFQFLNHVLIFKKHPQVFQKYTEFHDKPSGHVIEAEVNVLPQFSQQVFILLENALFIVVDHQLV
jgi:hypothetical protein